MKNIRAFTLADSAEQSKKFAFTLAETLITLSVIGVVAALTMPALITNINERINSHRQANIAYKITQATDKMKALGLLDGSYATTDQFVDELQKHLKIAKRCDANHIAECWPTKKVITSDGEEFEVKNAKTGRNLNIASNKSNNVGLVLADGASIILTYNQDSKGMDVGEPIVANKKTLPVGFGKSEEFAYTTNTTGAIDFVMDVNGKKGPNSETRDNKMKDIRSFKVARFSKGCTGVDVAGIGCVVNLGTSYECLQGNCMKGAEKACNAIGLTLPNINTLINIAKKKSEYPNLPQSGTFWSSSYSYDFGYGYGHFVNFGSDEPYALTHPQIVFNGALCVGD